MSSEPASRDELVEFIRELQAERAELIERNLRLLAANTRLKALQNERWDAEEAAS